MPRKVTTVPVTLNPAPVPAPMVAADVPAVDVDALARQLVPLTHPWRLNAMRAFAQDTPRSYTVTEIIDLVGGDVTRASATEHMHVLARGGWVRLEHVAMSAGRQVLSFTPVPGMLSGVVAGLSQLGGVNGKAPRRRKVS